MSIRIEYGDLVFRAVIDPSSETKLIADTVAAGKKSEKAGAFKIKPTVDPSGITDALNKLGQKLKTSKDLFDSNSIGVANYAKRLQSVSAEAQRLADTTTEGTAAFSRSVAILADATQETNKLDKAQFELIKNTSKLAEAEVEASAKKLDALLKEEQALKRQSELSEKATQNELARLEKVEAKERETLAKREAARDATRTKELQAAFKETDKKIANLVKEEKALERLAQKSEQETARRIAQIEKEAEAERKALAKLQAARDKARTKEIEKGIVVAENARIQKEVDDLNKLRDALARIQAEYRKTGGDGRKTALELRELAEAIERQRAALPATSNLFRAYDKTLTQTYSAANRLDGKLDRLSLGFSLGQNLVRGATSQLSRFGAVGDLAGDTMGLLATGATGLSTGAIAATAGVAALTVGLVALDKVGNANFKQLEESTDFLSVNGVENIGIFIQSLRELQDESKLAATFTTGQLANAAQEIVRANRSEAESLDILRNSITFAVSEKKDLALVGLELSTVMRQFNIDTSQAGEVANKFAQAGNLAKVGASEFLEGIANAGDQLAAFGFSLDEGLALLIEMDNKGFSPADKGARALSGALSAIGSPTQKAMGVFKELGITTTNVRQRFIQLVEILANSEDAATKLQDAFDDNGESVEFLGQIVDNFVERGLFKLTKEGFLELTERIGEADDAMGLLTEAMSDNRAIAAGALKTAMTELGTAVSTGLNPIITGTYNILTNILNAATDIINFGDTAAAKKQQIDSINEQIDRLENPGFLDSLGNSGSGIGRAFGGGPDNRTIEELKRQRDELQREYRALQNDALFPSGLDLGTSYEPTKLGFEARNVGLDIPVTVIDSVKEYDAAIESLNEEISTLTDRSEIASRQDKIKFLEDAKNNLLGIEKKEKKGSKKKTVYDELAEGTEKYRDALADLVKGRELGAFNSENEILEAKLKANNQYIELLYTNFEYLSDAEKGYLQNALALNDVLEQRKIELENIQALQDTFDNLSEAGTQANKEAAFFGTLEAKLDAAKTRVGEFQKALKEALANPVSSQAQLEYLRTRLGIEEGIVGRLEEQIELAEKLADARLKNADVFYDPTTGTTQKVSQLAVDLQIARDLAKELERIQGLYNPLSSIATPQPNLGGYFSDAFGAGGVNPEVSKTFARQNRYSNFDSGQFNARDNALFFLTDQSVRTTQQEIQKWEDKARQSFESQERINEVLKEIEAELSIGSVASYEFSSNLLKLSQQAALSGQYLPENSLIAPTKEQLERDARLREQERKLRELRNRQPVQAFEQRYDPTTGKLINVGSFNSGLDDARNNSTKTLQEAFSQIDAKALAFKGNLDLLGTGFDENALKADAVLGQINKMIAEGLDPQGEAVQNLIEDYKQLTARQRDIQNVNALLSSSINILNGFKGLTSASTPGGFLESFGSTSGGILDLLSNPLIGLSLPPGVSQLIQGGFSLLGGFTDFLGSLFDPTKAQRESLASAISDSVKSGMQSAISSFRNGEITLAELEIALKNSVYDSLFNASLNAFIDSAFQAAGLAPLIEEVAKAVISGNDAAVEDAFARFDAFLNSPEFQKFLDGAARLGKSLPRISSTTDEPTATQPTLVAPLQSIDAGIDFSSIIQGFKDFSASTRVQRETADLQRETAIKFDKAIERLLSAPISGGRDGRAIARSNA